MVDYLLRKFEDAQLVPVTISAENRIDTITTWNNRVFENIDQEAILRLGPSDNIEAFFVAVLEKAS